MLKDALKFSKQNKDMKDKQKHSQSVGQSESNAGDKDQAAQPPQFDKNILNQHRNSLDSEFNNNKGKRKLKPAQKGEGGQQPMKPGGKKEEGMGGQKQNENSNSLDDLEFLAQEGQTMPVNQNGQP